MSVHRLWCNESSFVNHGFGGGRFRDGFDGGRFRVYLWTVGDVCNR